MNYYFYAILFILLAWFLFKQFAPVKGLRNLNIEQFKKEYKGQRLIDVREVHEFKQGHLPGAVNIPLSQIHRRLGEIPKESPVYLYCRSGMRSKQAGRILSRSGYRNVAHLNGGITAWDGPLTK
ncbi:rhodanese-like domain-containing protein [Paenibacillus validus]|uniref:Rhodanese-like domain-containing protein n=1 Tax=Paenibacillus chartarius TaxID=747481 RepID=A0ABV6DLS9_9BACL|nr:MULTISPECIES: rhodanese-like domain-containing protein [Paenibacillaceae]MED4600059.1 rhodanese-like domain-containing protein [Paenibacillus validus]MED4605674.1 rhodanese-like domain-containing protein [Paenibacillus validus]NTZ20703.1 rhodanese-like domain-containing protein [Paenibacillus sp. JMULE4]SMF25452.1 Rhodanese-related sulfurtransferase [Paenibacillus barengoltzii]